MFKCLLNNHLIPNEIIREIYLFFSIKDIILYNIKDNILWFQLLFRDYKIIDYVTPYKKYLNLYNEPYIKPEKTYKVIFDYVIYTLLYMYKYTKNDEIEASEIEQLNENNYLNMLQNEFFNSYKESFSLYKFKLSKNDINNTLLIDNRLTQLILINISGYNAHPKAHNNDTNIINIDEIFWSIYQGKFKINNPNGITLYDLIYGIYMIKSSKFNNQRENFNEPAYGGKLGRIKNVIIEDLPYYEKKMIIKVRFNNF